METHDPSQEWLQCFDEEGHPTEARTRVEVKTKPYRWWCGVSNIWLVNDKGQLLCSKRSEKVSGNPGKWQTYFGGHVPSGLTFRQTAVKELKEEVGLDIGEEELYLVKKGQDIENKKFYESYAVCFNGASNDFRFPDGEVTEVKWMDMSDYCNDQEHRPDMWCNGCKPEQQQVIFAWLSSVQGHQQRDNNSVG